MTDLANLEEILSPENVILVDGSVRGNRDQTMRFGEIIRDAKQFNQIKLEDIELEHGGINELYEILQNDNVWTLKEVSDEIKRYAKHLGNQIPRLSANQKRIPKYISKEFVCGEYSQEVRIQYLQEKVFEMSQLAREKDIKQNRELNFDSEKYNSLFEMTKLISDALELKCGRKEFVKKENKSYTDEMLAAGIFYLSMYSNKTPVLVSADTDFVSLLGVVPRIIGADEFMPENNDFRIALIHNPFKLYIRTLEGFESTMDSSEDLEFNQHFYLNNKLAEQERIKPLIASLWKDINPNPVQLSPLALQQAG